jgi:hypothetical protein
MVVYPFIEGVLVNKHMLVLKVILPHLFPFPMHLELNQLHIFPGMWLTLYRISCNEPIEFDLYAVAVDQMKVVDSISPYLVPFPPVVVRV